MERLNTERPPITLKDFLGCTGCEIGCSSWLLVDQARIDAFAAATLVTRIIDIDADGRGNPERHDPERHDPERHGPERAERQTGGATSHGFLVLSLLSAMAYEVLPSIIGTEMVINYGFNGLRFLNPVSSGGSIRGRFTLVESTERRPGQWQSVYRVVVEILNAEKPALTAEWLSVAIVP